MLQCSQMTDQAAIEEKQQIISQIKQYVPLFSHFFDISTSLRQYSSQLRNFQISPIHQQRQGLIRRVIEQKLRTLFGDQYDGLRVNLTGNLAFNIADHHQVLNHPLLIGANVVSHIDSFMQPVKQDAIVVISSGDVPPNNYFSKSGFQFHDKRVPLFSVSEKEYSSYYIPKRDFDFVSRLKAIDRWSEFDEAEQAFLEKYNQQLTSIDFSQTPDYKDQITKIVKETWPLLFEESIRPNLPELLYITQEEVTTNCLIELLEKRDEPGNFIIDTLFDAELRSTVLDTFRGIVVAWRESEGKGTHFFWRKHPDKPQSIRMFVEGNQLVPQHNDYRHLAVPLERETIIQMLKDKEIYPSLFLIFSVLNFYAGVKPLTGYGSTVYLELFRQAWLKSLRTHQREDEARLVEGVDLTGFVAGVPIFFNRINNELKTLYAADIFAQGGITANYLEKIFAMPFNQLLDVAVADIYDYYAQKYVPTEAKLTPKIGFDDLVALTFKDL